MSAGSRVVLSTFSLAGVPAGAASDPAGLAALAPAWTDAEVPGTVASSLRRAKQWSWDDRRDFDAEDFWYRTTFACASPGETPRPPTYLVFHGLATLCDVFLNGEKILTSENAFQREEVEISAKLRPENELHLRFRSLGAALGARRPRPRWKTRLASHQQLRWFRTSLLGRMPSWSPRPAGVGPYRDVVLEERPSFTVVARDVASRVDGTDGVVRVRLVVAPAPGVTLASATLHVGAEACVLSVSPGADGTVVLDGEARVPSAPLWWPHTHGPQPLFDVKVDAGGTTLDLGRAGFRTITVDTEGERFSLHVNGVPVFCRGGCWTPPDVVSLVSSPDELARTLGLVRRAGMNAIRVGGTMVYEPDAFHALCDELGILVIQDVMLANFDYPDADAAFMASLSREVRTLLDRLALSPSLAVVCGGSEVEQQASMMGVDRALFRSRIFAEVIPDIVRERRPDVAYVPNSPSGGALPFLSNAGLAHYYGVGAYLRPIEDVRRADVKFASECLAFACVPETVAIEELLADGQAPAHHPRWKERVPRDNGSGWDFEDVRDHYVKELYGLDPMRLRYADVERYLALGRVVVGELMAATFAEWRRPGSSCRGGLVFLLRDLWPGAGWGILDSAGRPKSGFHYLARALQPVSVVLSDEGLNGLYVHALNETADALAARLRVTLYRAGHVRVAEHLAPIAVPARGHATVHVEAVLGFYDTTYAYRFGPPVTDLVLASLETEDGTVLAESVHFPVGLPRDRDADLGTTARATARGDGSFELVVASQRFAHAVAIDVPGFAPDDAYFHVRPGGERTTVLRPVGKQTAPRGVVYPVNAASATNIAVG